MEKHKKKILILIGVILVLIALIAVLLGLIFKDEKPDEPIKTPTDKVEEISKEIEILNDSGEFLGIQLAINNFYELLKNKEIKELLEVLDIDYINEKNITSNNLYTYFNDDYENVFFIAKEIYYNPNSPVTFYFINGYLMGVDMFGESDYYESSVNYLIVKNKNNDYVIRPLDNNLNISDIARNYKLRNKEIDSNHVLTTSDISEENKLTIYINEFMSLLVYDNKRAYELLDDETKKKYVSYEDFLNKSIEIYNSLSSKIFAYSKQEINGKIVYRIKDDKQNNIMIYETSIMNYKIRY